MLNQQQPGGRQAGRQAGAGRRRRAGAGRRAHLSPRGCAISGYCRGCGGSTRRSGGGPGRPQAVAGGLKNRTETNQGLRSALRNNHWRAPHADSAPVGGGGAAACSPCKVRPGTVQSVQVRVRGAGRQAVWWHAAMQGGVHQGARWGWRCRRQRSGGGRPAALRYLFFSWDHGGGARRHWAALIWLFYVTASRAVPQPLHSVRRAVSMRDPPPPAPAGGP